MDFTDLAQYGTTGVCIALVVALVYIIKAVLKLMGNHLNHNTKMMERLCGKIDQDIEIGKEMKRALLNYNGKK